MRHRRHRKLRTECETETESVKWNMKPHMLFAALIAGALFAEGGSNMPMLKWAGKDKVVNHHNEVPFRVLERKWGHILSHDYL